MSKEFVTSCCGKPLGDDPVKNCPGCPGGMTLVPKNTDEDSDMSDTKIEESKKRLPAYLYRAGDRGSKLRSIFEKGLIPNWRGEEEIIGLDKGSKPSTDTFTWAGQDPEALINYYYDPILKFRTPPESYFVGPVEEQGRHWLVATPISAQDIQIKIRNKWVLISKIDFESIPIQWQGDAWDDARSDYASHEPHADHVEHYDVDDDEDLNMPEIEEGRNKHIEEIDSGLAEKIKEGTVTVDDFNRLIQEATPESLRDRLRRRPMAQRNTVKSHQDDETGHAKTKPPKFADRVQPKREREGRTQMHGRGRQSHRQSARTQKRTMSKSLEESGRFGEAITFLLEWYGKPFADYNKLLAELEDKAAVTIVARKLMSKPGVNRDWLNNVCQQMEIS